MIKIFKIEVFLSFSQKKMTLSNDIYIFRINRGVISPIWILTVGLAFLTVDLEDIP